MQGIISAVKLSLSHLLLLDKVIQSLYINNCVYFFKVHLIVKQVIALNVYTLDHKLKCGEA